MSHEEHSGISVPKRERRYTTHDQRYILRLTSSERPAILTLTCESHTIMTRLSRESRTIVTRLSSERPKIVVQLTHETRLTLQKAKIWDPIEPRKTHKRDWPVKGLWLWPNWPIKNTGGISVLERESRYMNTLLWSQALFFRLKMRGNDVEAMMVSEAAADWIKVLKMLRSKVHDSLTCAAHIEQLQLMAKTRHYVAYSCKACLFALYVLFLSYWKLATVLACASD